MTATAAQGDGVTVISDALLVDGTGAPAVPADVVVARGRIAAVEPPGSVVSGQVTGRIGAAGQVVCPGFIDARSPADNAPLRERRVLELPEAVRRMTSLPAEIFGVPERGTVAVGKVADLVCFDPSAVGHPGGFLNPAVPPTGISWVMQDGHVVLDHGGWAGVRRGSRLEPQ